MTRISFLPATVLAVAVLGVAIAASLFFGSNNISPGQVWASLSNNGDTATDTLVLQQRLPRTIVVVLVGAALGVAGAGAYLGVHCLGFGFCFCFGTVVECSVFR